MLSLSCPDMGRHLAFRCTTTELRWCTPISAIRMVLWSEFPYSPLCVLVQSSCLFDLFLRYPDWDSPFLWTLTLSSGKARPPSLFYNSRCRLPTTDVLYITPSPRPIGSNVFHIAEVFDIGSSGGPSPACGKSGSTPMAGASRHPFTVETTCWPSLRAALKPLTVSAAATSFTPFS